VLALRLAARKQPLPLLDAQRVLGPAALEDVVGVGVDRIGNETACLRLAGRTVGKGPAGGRRSGVGEDLVPVVRGARRARRAQGARLGVAVQLEPAEDAGRDAVLELFQAKAAARGRLAPLVPGLFSGAVGRSDPVVDELSEVTVATHDVDF